MGKYIIYLGLVLLPLSGNSQNIQLLNSLKDSINTNAHRMVSAQSDEQKFKYSDRINHFVLKFTEQEKSIKFNMDSLKLVKVLTAKNEYLRIFSWAIPLENGQYTFKGVVQSYSKSKKTYKTSVLTDKTARLSRAYSKTLTADKWYGAYYYHLIHTKRGSKDFYTLLGWKGVNKVKQSKVIEVVSLKSNGDVVFGYNLFSIRNYEYFKKTPSVKRLIFTYSSLTNMYLNYDRQTIVEKSSKKSKRGKSSKKKPGFNAQTKLETPKEKTKSTKGMMIVMDRLVPTSLELIEFYEFYYPESNIIDALRYEKSTWKYYPDIDARNKEETPKPAKKVEYDLTPKE